MAGASSGSDAFIAALVGQEVVVRVNSAEPKGEQGKFVGILISYTPGDCLILDWDRQGPIMIFLDAVVAVYKA